MSFKIEFVDQLPSVSNRKKAITRRTVNPDELSELVEELFPSTVPSGFYFIWGQKKLPSDFISLSNTLDEWLRFCDWAQSSTKDNEHFDPWDSDVRMSFDARRNAENIVTLISTGGEVFEDINSENEISAHSSVFLGELRKLLVPIQKKLAEIDSEFLLLDKVLIGKEGS